MHVSKLWFLFSDDVVELLMVEIEQILADSGGTYSPAVNFITMQIGQKILEQSRIIQCTNDPEFEERYISILKKYLQWFLNPR